MEVQIAESWKKALQKEFEQDYFKNIVTFLKQELLSGKTIYPKGKDIFNAFTHTPFDKVKVVILGQDPYHGPGQAHGLSFSVPNGIQLPPSLKNIFKELKNDLNQERSASGDLTTWAQQGVLLLNASLTVEAGKAGSHAKIGWHIFTDKIIQLLSENKSNIVFILWGNFAKQKANLIDSKRHLILSSAHPSPLSAHNGFWGNHHFSKTNVYLQEHNYTPINWQL